MNVIDRLESSLFFRTTRYVCFVVCLLAFIGMVGALIFAAKLSQDKYSIAVDPASIVDPLVPKLASQSQPPQSSHRQSSSFYTTPSALADVSIPFEIQRYVSTGPIRDQLLKLLSSRSPAERDEIFRELRQIVKRSEELGLNVERVIENYIEEKHSKIMQAEIKETAAKTTALTSVAVAGGLFLVVASVTLILVLLAIERNTRTRSAA